MSKKLPPRNGPSIKKISDLNYEESNFIKRFKLGLLVLFVAILIGCSLSLYQYLVKYTYPIPTLSTHPLASDPNAFDPFTWGSYRPQLYFGLQSRHPKSIAFGLLWYTLPSFKTIRHWCDQGEKVVYMWHDHDGETFGHQIIQDNELHFTTDWYNQGRSVAASIKINPQVNNKQDRYYFMFYFIHNDNIFLPIYKNDNFIGIRGEAPGYGKFRIYFNVKGDVDISETSFNGVNNFGNYDGHYKFKENLVNNSGQRLTSNDILTDDIPRYLWYIHFGLSKSSTLEFRFVAEGDKLNKDFDEVFDVKIKEFQQKFVEKFELNPNGDEAKYIPTAKAALSNLLGGVGYWSGFSNVQVGKEVKPYGRLNLTSAVPSRPFFPRGFLWDEGFHNLVIKNFNPSLTLQIISSWLDSMDSDGWIPREMILTNEAAQKVPPEFIVQNNNVANPPSIFYLIDSLMRSTEFMTRYSRDLYRLYPRLKQWYLWLKKSQTGSLQGTFQWQGRNASTNLELNPKTLASGLDDYPRATHPNTEEYHLDLLCWMALSSRVVRHLAELTSDHDFMPIIEKDMSLFNNFDHLNKHHWSDEKKKYFDYGRHSYKVQLEKFSKNNVDFYQRVVNELPKHRLVDNVIGYVNLFPFFFRLLPGDSEQLKYSLLLIKNDLWTDYGLRSLSEKSAFYLKRNTEHDPPYWRGQIWINLNYLTLSALKHYSNSGPYHKTAANLYAKLRSNLIENIHKNYVKTGYFYENYNDSTGIGGGSHPFTGWTSLIVNILAEKYD